jgi:hypothetical protein
VRPAVVGISAVGEGGQSGHRRKRASSAEDARHLIGADALCGNSSERRARADEGSLRYAPVDRRTCMAEGGARGTPSRNARSGPSTPQRGSGYPFPSIHFQYSFIGLTTFVCGPMHSSTAIRRRSEAVGAGPKIWPSLDLIRPLSSRRAAM